MYFALHSVCQGDRACKLGVCDTWYLSCNPLSDVLFLRVELISGFEFGAVMQVQLSPGIVALHTSRWEVNLRFSLTVPASLVFLQKATYL